jgi:hypothetical protein
MPEIPPQNSGCIMHLSVAIKVSYCEAIARWPPVCPGYSFLAELCPRIRFCSLTGFLPAVSGGLEVDAAEFGLVENSAPLAGGVLERLYGGLTIS